MPADAVPCCAATSPAPGIDRSTCVMPPQRQKVGILLVQALTLESHSSGPEQTRTSRCVAALAGLKIRSVEGRQQHSARKTVVEEKSVSVRVDLGGRRRINKNKKY